MRQHSHSGVFGVALAALCLAAVLWAMQSTDARGDSAVFIASDPAPISASR